VLQQARSGLNSVAVCRMQGNQALNTRCLTTLHDTGEIHHHNEGLSSESEVWHESENPSDSDEFDDAWANGTKLYFCDQAEWRRYDQDGVGGAVKIWQMCGANFVPNKSDCTHLVINYVRTGSHERDRRASEILDWARNQGVGMLQIHILGRGRLDHYESSGVDCC